MISTARFSARLWIVIILLSSPTKDRAQTATFGPITLEETLSVGNDDEGSLYQWSDITSDLDGCFYVTDAMDHRIKKFDPGGHLIGSAGGRGKQPGQFEAIRLIRYNATRLYVTDQNIPGIQVFDLDLRFHHRIPYGKPILDFHFTGTNRLVVSPLPWGGGGCLEMVDTLGSPIRSILHSEKGDPMHDAVDFAMDDHGDIIVAHRFKDLIRKIDEKGLEIWRLELLHQATPATVNVFGLQLPKQTAYTDVEIDTAGRILVLGGSFSPNRKRDVYVISPDGRLLTTFLLPEPSHRLYIDRQNDLYTRSRMGTMLKKYRMHGS